MKPTLLKPDELATALQSLPGWELSGQAMVKRFDFPSYLAGIDFVVQVAKEAEAMNHHPDLLIGWRKVTATLSTHSAGGVTELDLILARKMNDRAASFL